MLVRGENRLEAYGECKLEQFFAKNQQSPQTMRVFSVSPHAHGFGRKIWMTANNSRQGERLIQCDNMFEQTKHEFKIVHELGLAISSDDTLTIHCLYDTTNSSQDFIPGGFGTNEEMCAVSVYAYSDDENTNLGFCLIDSFGYRVWDKTEEDLNVCSVGAHDEPWTNVDDEKDNNSWLMTVVAFAFLVAATIAGIKRRAGLRNSGYQKVPVAES